MFLHQGNSEATKNPSVSLAVSDGSASSWVRDIEMAGSELHRSSGGGPHWTFKESKETGRLLLLAFGNFFLEFLHRTILRTACPTLAIFSLLLISIHCNPFHFKNLPPLFWTISTMHWKKEVFSVLVRAARYVFRWRLIVMRNLLLPMLLKDSLWRPQMTSYGLTSFIATAFILFLLFLVFDDSNSWWRRGDRRKFILWLSSLQICEARCSFLNWFTRLPYCQSQYVKVNSLEIIRLRIIHTITSSSTTQYIKLIRYKFIRVYKMVFVSQSHGTGIVSKQITYIPTTDRL